jgi:hypothetical protein
MKNLADEMRDANRANSKPLLMAADTITWKMTFGSIAIRELIANIRAGSESIEIQTQNVEISLDTCYAILYSDPATMERLRKGGNLSLNQSKN